MTDEEICDIARDIEPDAWFGVHSDDEAWVIKFALAIEAKHVLVQTKESK